MLGIQLVAYGDPTVGLVCSELEEPPQPAAGQVLVDMKLAPVGPTDLFFAQGHFGTSLPLPSVIGGEGVGQVRSLGAGVEGVQVGDYVTVTAPTFTWAQRVLAPSTNVVVLPSDIDLAQASMLGINPTTASLLLSEFADLKPGDWVVQNAGNSGVGRSVIAFAQSRGLRTINLVRRPELVDELKAAGADAVLLPTDDFAMLAKKAVGDGQIRLALDGLGGGASKPLSQVLSPGGHLVTYVATGEPMTLDAQAVIFNELVVGGFFIYQSRFASKLRAARLEAVELVASGRLRIPVVATYPVKKINEAVKRAQQGGKVLIDFSDEA